MAIEWGPLGIRVKTIAPTFIRAPMAEQTLAIPERCNDAGIPVVMFNRGQDTGNLAQVTSNNIEAGRTVAHFLACAGHRKIAHISGWQQSSTGVDRTRGFVDGLKEHGLEPFAIADGNYGQDTASAIAR